MAFFLNQALCLHIFMGEGFISTKSFGISSVHSLNTHAIAGRSEVLLTCQVERLGYPALHMSI